tara:strand:+ start:2000 stop:2107 length:108 start_codon:yes stop_codon:yes gene_type:complete
MNVFTAKSLKTTKEIPERSKKLSGKYVKIHVSFKN